MPEEKPIVLFESSDLIGPPLRSIMSKHGAELQVFPDRDVSRKEAIEAAARASCVLVEGSLRGDGAAGLIRDLRSRGCGTPIIVAVRSGDSEAGKDFLAAGATDVVGIPLVYAYLMNRLGDFDTTAASCAPHRLTLRGGVEVTFRFLHPKDREIEQAFVRALSDRSRYLRFFTNFKELPDGFLETFTHSEFPRSYAVIATVCTDGEETQIGVARYAPTEDSDTAEFAVVVADAWQRQGLASSLLHIVMVAAAIAGYRQLDGMVLKENTAMLALAKKLGFRIVVGHRDGPGVLRLRKTLAA